VIDAIKEIQVYPDRAKEIFKKNSDMQEKIMKLSSSGVLYTRK
jgi:hypothetical protein